MKASKLLTMLLSAVITSAYAVDNSIYIDQLGDNATVTITQDGAGNRVKGIVSGNAGNTTDPAKIYGDGVNVTVNQTGAGNSLAMGVVAVVGNANSADITYNVSGGNNTGYINLNNAGASGAVRDAVVSITQSGGGNTTNVRMLGGGNNLTATQSGGGATLISDVNADATTQTIATSGGTGNSVTTTLTGDKGTVNVAIVGGSNTVDITQNGGGANGHNVGIDLNGSGNTVTTLQQGTIDTAINLKSVGSSNTFTLTSKN